MPLTVNCPVGVAAGDLVARQADHALDEMVVVVGCGKAEEREHVGDRRRRSAAARPRTQPSARVGEHDDVAALQRR